MNTPKETFEMKTNFAGLIQLLAKSLYSHVLVFVRELLQNGGDSITLRREVEPDHKGRIEVFTYPKQNTIIFRDNGMGMNKQDIMDFLSVIGSTGTGSARDRLAVLGNLMGNKLVGRYGIGMLSAFVVAKKVVVRTLKLGETTAYAWHNEGTTVCELYEDDKAEVGTEVALILEDKYTHLLESSTLRKAIRKFCDFLRYPIYLNDEGPVNVMNAPWHQEHWTSEKEKVRAYASFLNERFADQVIRVIPVNLTDRVQAKGALYITEGKIPDLTSNGRVDLYVRRFLIAEGDSHILPEWAPFVGGIIDCPELQPTASRDNVQRNDPKLAILREELANTIVDYLSRMAHDEPDEFAKVNECHNYHLKGMAVFHDEFFDLFAHKLLFDTNKGKMSLDTYLSANTSDNDEGPVPLYHFSQRQSRNLFYEMADQSGLVVIDAKRTFESDLLGKFEVANPHKVVLAPIDVGLNEALFQMPSTDDSGLVDRLELALMQTLSQAGFASVDVRVRCFLPASVPSVALATPQTVAHQTLRAIVSQNWVLPSLGSLTREMHKAMDDTMPVRIVVNLNNELVRRVGAEEFRYHNVGDVLSALIFDNPAGGGELVDGKLRTYAATCKHRVLHAALDSSEEENRSAEAKGA